MIDLININLNKRLSIISIIFVFISLFLITVLLYYNASFNISNFELLDNKELILENYILDSIQTIEIIGVFFVIFLVALELFYNINNFDAYFIALTNKRDYFISKITSYIIIITLYFLLVFINLIIIYTIRFNEIKELQFLLEILKNYMLYYILIFMISYVVLLLFYNYFSSIILFIFYWISKMTEEDNFINKYILLNIKIDFKERKIFTSFTQTYFFFYIIILTFLALFIYKKKDLKINS